MEAALAPFKSNMTDNKEEHSPLVSPGPLTALYHPPNYDGATSIYASFLWPACSRLHRLQLRITYQNTSTITERDVRLIYICIRSLEDDLPEFYPLRASPLDAARANPEQQTDGMASMANQKTTDPVAGPKG